MTWNNFYSATAGASATLLGLLFVAVQLHLDALYSDSLGRWRARARSTFDQFLLLFSLSLLMLFPLGSNNGNGPLLLAVVAAGIVRLLWTWLPVWRSHFPGRREKIVELLWLLASPLMAYTAIGIFAVEMWRVGQSFELQQSIGYCIVGIFAIALRNSWALLVVLAAEKKSVSSPGAD